MFAVNYGEVGFLATIDPDDDGDLADGFERALSPGDFETLDAARRSRSRRPTARTRRSTTSRSTAAPASAVARAAPTRSSGEEIGSVRCDGLVLATPAGSTGYNLANGGPVMAWGVEGFVVSFIAPHSLTARALVVAPDDLLSVHNRSRDRRRHLARRPPAGSICPDEAITASFLREAADLAQVPGSSFYRRLREKFGRLAR